MIIERLNTISGPIPKHNRSLYDFRVLNVHFYKDLRWFRMRWPTWSCLEGHLHREGRAFEKAKPQTLDEIERAAVFLQFVLIRNNSDRLWVLVGIVQHCACPTGWLVWTTCHPLCFWLEPVSEEPWQKGGRWMEWGRSILDPPASCLSPALSFHRASLLIPGWPAAHRSVFLSSGNDSTSLFLRTWDANRVTAVGFWCYMCHGSPSSLCLLFTYSFCWSRVDLQCCVNFCGTAKWLSYIYYVCIYM